MPSPNLSGITPGQLQPSSTWGDFNNIAFVIQQFLSKIETATLVRVESCTNNGALSPVGFVDVTPLVNQVDSQGNPTKHVTVYNLPYMRVQGGANAIIMDPQIGDIGVAVFASRDISKIKATKAQGNPGSARQYNFADGMYLGGMLNGTPTQYVQFNTAGIKLHSAAAIVLDAPDIKLQAATIEINGTTSATVTTQTFTVNCATVINGTLSQTGGGTANISGALVVAGDVSAQGTSVHTHKHSGVTTGGGQTGAPV